MAGIKQHPFFRTGLPPGALGMNDHLLQIRPFSDPVVSNRPLALHAPPKHPLLV